MSTLLLLPPFLVWKEGGRTGSCIFSFSALNVSHIWYLEVIRQLSLLVDFALDNLHQHGLEVVLQDFQNAFLVRFAAARDINGPAARDFKQNAPHLLLCGFPAAAASVAPGKNL
jgi:hypothetical protein